MILLSAIADEMYKVLIVEDNDINQKVLCAYLNQENISVTITKNGNEAVSKCKETRFDLILMDIAMPEMDGFEATMEIRKIEAKKIKITPILAVTASDPHNNREKYLSAGFNDYIAKPIDLHILFEKIHEHSEVKFMAKEQSFF